MNLSLSTHWNAHRHGSGEALIEEILGLGLKSVELGYDLTMDLVPGVLSMAAQGAVAVTSVHNYCPVPLGVPQGHPELFLLTSSEARVRQRAITQTLKTVEFAAKAGASTVVLHAGRVEMKSLTRQLLSLADEGLQFQTKYDKTKMKLLLQRDKKIKKHLDHLYSALETMLPSLEAAGVALGLEILPSWEAIPSEMEMEQIATRFNSPFIRYWYDTGHGRIRENLGLVSSMRWLERLSPHLAGMHLHDVSRIGHDHLMPPVGDMDFTMLKSFLRENMPLVLEPAPGMPVEMVEEGIQIISEAFNLPQAG